jgi:uncharacterized protein with GYD domain
MPKYMQQVSYTLDGVQGLLAKGAVARKTIVQAAAKSLGGKVDAFYFAFGENDVYVITELPNNTAAAALALAVTAAGAATVKTVVLLTPEEMDKARDTKVKYRAPGH